MEQVQAQGKEDTDDGVDTDSTSASSSYDSPAKDRELEADFEVASALQASDEQVSFLSQRGALLIQETRDLSRLASCDTRVTFTTSSLVCFDQIRLILHQDGTAYCCRPSLLRLCLPHFAKDRK